MRLRDYCYQKWHMVSIRVKVVVEILDAAGQVLATFPIWSIGCYNVESDSGKDHFDAIFREELDSLRPALHELGFTDDQIDAVEVQE